MRLHDNPRSNNAQKVRFLLGELGLDYERREVPFGEERPAWHRAVNPVGGIPALVDGDLQLAESGAILRYLAARAGRDDLYPADLADRARVDWLLDAIGMTLRPLLREVERPALGWRPRRGIDAGPRDPAAGAEALRTAVPALEAFAALLDDASPWAVPRPLHHRRRRRRADAAPPAALRPRPRGRPAPGRVGRRRLRAAGVAAGCRRVRRLRR